MLDLFRYRFTQSELNHATPGSRHVPNSSHSLKKGESLPRPFVLILGKDKDTRFLFKTAFELWSYDVADACNPEQALGICAYKIPDLVLMDTEFDFQSSLAMLQGLQNIKTFRGCGFILVSGHAQENIRKTALAAGADFFLVKPIDFEVLRKFLWIYFKERNPAIS